MIVQLERYQNQVDPEQFEGTHQVSSSLIKSDNYSRSHRRSHKTLVGKKDIQTTIGPGL